MGKKIRNSRQRALDRLAPNPHGANQWISDPRQQLFLAYYLDPKSTTFSNALQSGLRAGFSPDYSDNILAKMPTWLSEKVGNSALLMKAEKNLQEMLELPTKTHAMGAFGPLYKKLGKGKNAKKEPIMSHNIGLIKIKSDVSQFVAERVGRKKYGPRASEGGNTFNVMIFANEQRDRIAKRIIGGGSVGNQPSETVAN